MDKNTTGLGEGLAKCQTLRKWIFGRGIVRLGTAFGFPQGSSSTYLAGGSLG